MPKNRARTIRLATADDADDCLELYRPVVDGTPISFEKDVPSTAEFAERITRALEVYPWIVCELSGHFSGYAYAGSHRQRSAYQWSVEVSAYVDPRYHRQGVGRLLYERLFACLRRQGFFNAYAGITLPNDPSVSFHESIGFEPVGVYPRIGYKLGAWHDVGWWSLRLAENDSPLSPTPLRDCRHEIEAILRDD